MSFKIKVHCGSQKTIYVNRDNIHDAYFNDVRKYPILTEKEEKELINTYKFGKTEEEREKAKEKLITSNLRFVISIAKDTLSGISLNTTETVSSLYLTILFLF